MIEIVDTARRAELEVATPDRRWAVICLVRESERPLQLPHGYGAGLSTTLAPSGDLIDEALLAKALRFVREVNRARNIHGLLCVTPIESATNAIAHYVSNKVGAFQSERLLGRNCDRELLQRLALMDGRLGAVRKQMPRNDRGRPSRRSPS